MKVIAIYGRNASGKTRYVEDMRRRLATDSVRYMAFRDSYGAQLDGSYYLQLRWNQHDIDQETPTVGELLEKAYKTTGDDTPERRQLQASLYELLGTNQFNSEYIISLSSGELRKFQLTRTLLSDPKILILDNPFIGLDAPTRQQLSHLLRTISEKRQTQIYIVVSRESDIPDYVTERITLPDPPQLPLPEVSSEVFQLKSEESAAAVPVSSDASMAAASSSRFTLQSSRNEVITMRNVCIRYGQRTILDSLNWTVHQGEHWALSGPNGSGKSTLLSLVCADNPQGYACDIKLFGQQRGSGETIWQIKRRIGYVSPEMHRSYHRDLPALRIVASGLKDTVGLYVRPNEQEREQCRWWMRMFGLEGMEERSFLRMSSGEQRLVLLARAFVKNPELLILDEPLHGLDDENRRRVTHIIDTFCQQPQKTLIFVTHYREEWPQCIDHTLTLNRVSTTP